MHYRTEHHRTFFLVFFGLIALILFSGCGAPKEVIRQPVDITSVNPLEVLRRCNENAAKIRHIKSVATMNVESPKSGGQFTAQIAIRLPDSVYIKIEGMLGIDGVKASLNRESFVVYNIINKQVIIGKTSASAIRRTFDYNVNYEELVELLVGLPRVPESELVRLREFSADDTYFVMQFTTGEGHRKIWFDPYAQFAVSRIVDYDSTGDVSVEREFSRFQKIDGRYFPKYVRLVRPREQDLLSLFFDMRTVNESFNSSIFKIKYPRDIDIVEMQ
ncbi:DUF4292 domain-containing protein [bacterium]|nr:DUF4292 domain-containing protein [bacterium]NUN45555.1 DUF4292 domain-containing protein [bacterium]